MSVLHRFLLSAIHSLYSMCQTPNTSKFSLLRFFRNDATSVVLCAATFYGFMPNAGCHLLVLDTKSASSQCSCISYESGNCFMPIFLRLQSSLRSYPFFNAFCFVVIIIVIIFWNIFTVASLSSQPIIRCQVFGLMVICVAFCFDFGERMTIKKKKNAMNTTKCKENLYKPLTSLFDQVA